MKWTNEDKKALVAFRDMIDCDDIKIKEQIKKVLLNNRFIVKVLNNKELEECDSEPEDYYGVNILPYYLIYPTQIDVQNFLCYEVSYREVNRSNSSVKILQIIFHILCEQKGIIETNTKLCRHDLLAALVQDQFNYTNYLGNKIQLVEDVASTVDTSYACRTLVFEQITDNNLVKTKNGVPRLANKDVVMLGK